MRYFNPLIIGIVLLLSLFACSNKSPKNESTKTMVPEWSKEVIWYQIFVERFHNGDTSNDPGLVNIATASDFVKAPNDWEITPWTQEWYKEDDWAKDLPGDFYSHLQLRRYGGDLQGVMDKLDHLVELGITAVYFNPLNDAPSLHKYDARNYHHIDVNFGPDPAGDMKIIANEDPSDPSTWQWTSADKLFLQLIEAFHSKGIRVVLDYSWNHTGVEFWAWKDLVKNQQNSPYKDWYEIISFDDPETQENEFSYKGWINISSLPELKKVDAPKDHRSGFPYEGNLNEITKQHIFEVTKRWLAPDGDKTKGLDGFRLDVADHVPMGFWRDYMKFVKNINPDAYLVGEIWWQEYPDDLMNPVPFVDGQVFDAIMFYQLYRPARYFFAKTNFEITADEFKDSLNYQWNRLTDDTKKAMMNTASTHDTPRLLSSFYNSGKYKFRAKPSDDVNYKTGKPDEETYKRVELYLLHQFTIPGSPHIWNGEELGMWGSDDPDCRKPLWWPDMNFEPENRNNFQTGTPDYDEVGFNSNSLEFYKKIIQVRKNNPVLSHGDMEFLFAQGKSLVYKRFDATTEIIVAFNLSDSTFSYKLPTDGTYTDLLTGKGFSSTIELEPLSGHILSLQTK